MLSMHRMGRKGKVICNGGWLINLLFCDGFFDSASVLTISVAEMTFSLAYILNDTLYHIDEIGRRAGDVMSYASLFVGREKSVRCGSLCNKKTRLAPISAISVTTERSRSLGACLWCLALTSMSRRFLQRRYDIRGGEENASSIGIIVKHEELRLLEMT